MKTGTSLSEFLGEFRAAVFLSTMTVVPLLFLAAVPTAQAKCTPSGQIIICDSETPQQDPDGIQEYSDGWTITVGPGRISTGNKSAISVGSKSVITIENNIHTDTAAGYDGHYGEGLNTLEADSLNTITIDGDKGQVLATGNDTKAAAVKMIGYGNEITNAGIIDSKKGAAVWFRNSNVDSATTRNQLINSGVISTSSSAGIAIGSDDGLGLILENSGTIIGAISLGNGDDSLTFRDGSTITGDVSVGGGTNELTFESGSTLTGNVKTGDGGDTFTFHHEAAVSGDIDAGKGWNRLILSNDSASGVPEGDTLTGNLTGLSEIIKQGEGTWRLAGDLLLYTESGYVDPGLQKVTVEQGTLQLAGNISQFYGEVEIYSAGTLEAGAQNLPVWDPAQPSTDPNIDNEGTLRFVQNEGEDAKYGGKITGSGQVEKTGAGRTELSGENSYTGGTTVTEGILAITSDKALGLAGGGVVLDGGALEFAAANLALDSNRSLSLGENGGGLHTGDYDMALSHKIGGDGALTKTGEKTLTLSGENTYKGGTIINEGSLAISQDKNLGDADGGLTFGESGTLQFDADVTLAATRTVKVEGENTGTIDTQEYNGTVASAIEGDGTLIKKGIGALTLANGSNNFAGTTKISEGTLVAGAVGAFSSASLFDVGSGATLDLNGTNQTIGGLSGSGAVNFANQNLTIDQKATDEEAIFSGILNGAGGTLTKNGAGSLTLASALDSSINLVVNAGGHLGLKRDENLTLQNNLTGEGSLLVDLNGKKLSLDASEMGTNFNGTLALQNTKMDLDAAAEAVLGGAKLELAAGGEAKLLNDSTTIGGLVFNGGLLNVDDHVDDKALTVTDLDIKSGTIQADVSGITNNVDTSQNIFDFGTNAPQMAVIKAATITGNAEKLRVLDQYGQQTTQSSEDYQNGNGQLYFGVVASESGDGADKGVYLGYDLTGIEANAGKTVELDSTGSSSLRLEAQLTGPGSFLFTGDNDVQVGGNRESTYTGATTVDGLKVTAISNSAFGQTSLLELIDKGEFDLNGKSQTVGGLTDDGSNTKISLGSGSPSGKDGLTVDQAIDRTYSGDISGNGNFTKTGSGELILSGNNTYIGTTTVGGGTLKADSDNAFTKNQAWVVSGGTLDLNGHNLAMSQLSGTIRDSEIKLGGADLTVNGGGYRGVISGEGSLIKDGSGTLVLEGRNTYTGDTILKNGALSAGAAGVLSSVSVHQLEGFATLDLRGYNQTVAGLKSGSINTTVDLSSKAVLTVNSATDDTYAGLLTGDGSLVKNGEGQQTLTNADNDFSGGIAINEGSVKLTTAQAAGSGDLSVKAKAELIVDNSVDEAMVNNIRGQGSLIKSNSGNLALSGKVDLGTIEVQGGLMSLAGTVAADKFIIAEGATVDTEILSFTGNRTMDLTEAVGNFNYRRMEVHGLDNLVKGELDSAAGKDLHFVLPNGIRGGDVMLSIEGQALNIADARLSLEAGDYLRYLLGGDQIVLIDNTTGTIADSMDPYKAMYGATSYYFAVDESGEKLALNYEGRSTDTSPAKSYLEAPMAGLAMISDHGRVSADLASRQIAGSTGPGYGVLLGVTGSHNRVKTGSHAEIDGVSVLVGPTWRFDNLGGVSRLGVFFEGGNGEYDGYNRYVGRQVKSSGDIDHAGGMVFGRHDFNENYYVEASARLGRVETNYKTRDLGTDASFDSSALFWGVHVGGGYLHTINDQSSVQPYLNVYFTRQNSDDVTTKAKERVRLETADSVTTRLGARYSHAINETITARIGAAWDQELDGEQKGTIDGARIDSPTMKGASAFGEIGISIKPQDAPYFVELNAFGNAGKRDGGGGQASVGFNF